jgi:hypothetical protein
VHGWVPVYVGVGVGACLCMCRYVDAYYGPAAWREAAAGVSAAAVAVRARALADALLVVAAAHPVTVASVGARDTGTLHALRVAFLHQQLRAVAAYAVRLGPSPSGPPLSFDDEAAVLYGVRPPTFPASHFDSLLSDLNAALPTGPGTVAERYDAYKAAFVVPPDRVDAVFRAALDETRRRTRAFIEVGRQREKGPRWTEREGGGRWPRPQRWVRSRH